MYSHFCKWSNSMVPYVLGWFAVLHDAICHNECCFMITKNFHNTPWTVGCSLIEVASRSDSHSKLNLLSSPSSCPQFPRMTFMRLPLKRSPLAECRNEAIHYLCTSPQPECICCRLILTLPASLPRDIFGHCWLSANWLQCVMRTTWQRLHATG